MKRSLGPAFLFLLLSCACQQSEKQLSNPEQIVIRYQGFIDQNQFEKAKALSTYGERERLDELAMLLRDQPADSTILQTKFLRIECQQKSDTAFCYCLLEDQYEKYESNYLLVKRKGQWLVDLPREGTFIQDEVIREMLDSMELEILRN